MGEEIWEHYGIELDLEEEFELAESDVPALLDRLDLVLTRGALSDATREVIRTAVIPLEDAEERLVLALYLVLISPDYATAH